MYWDGLLNMDTVYNKSNCYNKVSVKIFWMVQIEWKTKKFHNISQGFYVQDCCENRYGEMVQLALMSVMGNAIVNYNPKND